jgi:hypothetical protein
MPNIQRIPDPPLTIEKDERLNQGPAEVWRPLLNAPGSWNACDVWFQVPEAQAGTLLRLFAINGSLRVPLFGPRSFNDASGVWKDSGGNRWSGIIFSVRSRPCDGFELEFTSNSNPAPRPARFRMECWWDCGPYSDDAGVIRVDPWQIGDPLGPRVLRYRSAPGGLPVGTTIMTGPPGPGARWDLIYASIHTSDPNPNPVTLQTRSLSPAFVTNQINLDMARSSSPWEYQGSGWPGGYDSQWEVVVSGPTPPNETHILAEWRLND